MRDIYERLCARGFEAKFIRKSILPDWWDDSLASNPANRAIAEFSIARLLCIKVAELRDHSAELSIPSVANFRLKCRSGTSPEEVRPAVIVANRISQLIDQSLSDIPDFKGPLCAVDIRRSVLSNSKKVDLKALVTFCWTHGIIVIHISPAKMPGSRKFDGLACFIQNRPCIVLGSGKDSPPWLAFHLAHEIGHICNKHVKPGDKPLVDSDLSTSTVDQQERISDRFATEVLTGNPEINLTFNGIPYPIQLAQSALQYGIKHNIDPGTVALLCARSGNFWASAQAAIKRLGESTGAQEIITAILMQHVDIETLPETTQRLLSCLSTTST